MSRTNVMNAIQYGNSVALTPKMVGRGEEVFSWTPDSFLVVSHLEKALADAFNEAYKVSPEVHEALFKPSNPEQHPTPHHSPTQEPRYYGLTDAWQSNPKGPDQRRQT